MFAVGEIRDTPWISEYTLQLSSPEVGESEDLLTADSQLQTSHGMATLSELQPRARCAYQRDSQLATQAL
jgi:hypothetical protein